MFIQVIDYISHVFEKKHEKFICMSIVIYL